MTDKKVGLLACSGEECLGGTLSRIATRRVMEKLRPHRAVTLCLPLYVAGGEEERNFAKEHPVITIEGCAKHCASKATETFSGKVQNTVDVAAMLGEDVAHAKTVSIRNLTEKHQDMVKILCREICAKMDELVL